MEIDLGQPEYLLDFFKNNNNVVGDMQIHEIRKDFTGRNRYVVLKKVDKEEPKKEEVKDEKKTA